MTNEFKVRFFPAHHDAALRIEEWLNGLHEGGWSVKLCHIRVNESRLACDETILVVANRWRRSTIPGNATDPFGRRGGLAPENLPADEVPSISYDEVGEEQPV